jgi:hypothetical protein
MKMSSLVGVSAHCQALRVREREKVQTDMQSIPRWTLGALCSAMAGLLLLSAAPALAAAPETPEVNVESIAAHTATLRGVLSPGATEPNEGGTYQFIYRPSSAECEGAGEIKAPASPGLSFGVQREEVIEPVAVLTAGTQYTVCLSVTNLKSETTLSAPVTFTTAIPPLAPETQKAEPVGATAATLHGVLNPGNGPATPGTYEFLYNASASECEGASRTSPATTAGAEEEVAAPVSGLSPSTQYTFCLLASNEAGETALGPPETFTTPAAAPTITGEEAASVGSDTATLDAQINPGGDATSYHLEYGIAGACSSSPCADYPTHVIDLGSGTSDLPVSVTVPGLRSGTIYFYRFRAANSVQASAGADRTFTTPLPPVPPSGNCPNDRPAYSANLPDCRAYEQASPVNKDGGIATGNKDAVQASSDGGAITFFSQSGLPGGTGAQDFPTYLASRGADAWSSGGLLPPAAAGEGADVLGWSPDLAQVYDQSTIPNGAQGFLRRNSSDGSLETVVPYTLGPPESWGFVGATTDGSEVLFEEQGAQLTPDAAAGQDNLYVWDRATSTVRLAGALPDGSPPPGGSFGGPYLWIRGDTSKGGIMDAEGRVGDYTQTALSTDGSKAIFTAAGGQLYLRSNPTSPTAATVHVSASQKTNGSGLGGADPNGPQPAAWLTSTPDGSHVFFSSCEQLTSDSTAAAPSPGSGCYTPEGSVTRAGSDLYRYDAASGQLTDLSVDPHPLTDDSCVDEGSSNAPNTPGCGANVQGVLGASADGSYVYFVANGVLAANAGAQGSHASPGDCGNWTGASAHPIGTCNLYLSHDGATTFIAPLSAGGSGLYSDSINWRPADYDGGQIQPKASRVTPDGQTLLFRSHEQLTPYDSHSPACALGGENPDGNCAELYRYSAPSGKLSCVSCDPTGAAAKGNADLRSISTEGDPGTEAPILTRNLSETGDSVFFESPDPLVAGDTNGSSGCPQIPSSDGAQTYACQDVYEWEASGASSCHSSADGGGCLYLLSTGTSPDPSFFGDASASGDDAFLFTQQPLVGQDADQLQDLYDARVGGGLASQNPPSGTPCSGESCKLPPSSDPSEPSVASVIFSGPGNQRLSTTGASQTDRVILPKTSRVILSHQTVRGSRVTLTVKAPAKGRLTVSGSGLKRLTKTVSRPGIYTLTASLTTSAKRTLKHKHKLNVTIRVLYAPATGSASSVRVKLSVRS